MLSHIYILCIFKLSDENGHHFPGDQRVKKNWYLCWCVYFTVWPGKVIRNSAIFIRYVFRSVKPMSFWCFFFMKYKTIFVLSIIYQKIDGTDSWNDSTWNTKALLLYCIVSIRAADSLATQSASASITMSLTCFSWNHGDVIKWKHFPRYWPFTRGIHQSPMNSPHKGHWRGAIIFCLICLNKWLSKQSRRRWSETSLRSL